jgi:N2-acetyl-L-2,4-diaminobutanoate deacetylase
MRRMIVRPDQLDLDSPGRRDYWVALEHDSIWRDHLIPVTVLVGPDARPGRGLVAFGSNHGNEYEGPVALKHLLGEISLADVLGRIILVPVLNPSAFHAGTRESADDGVNLNRAFIEGAGKTPALAGITHRIAAFVREHIWPRVHVVLDLHSGGDVARFALCASFHPLDDAEQSRQTEETARAFGMPASPRDFSFGVNKERQPRPRDEQHRRRTCVTTSWPSSVPPPSSRTCNGWGSTSPRGRSAAIWAWTGSRSAG